MSFKDNLKKNKKGGVSFPLMMTNKMRMNLRMMGYTDEELKHMRPEEGWEIIKKDNLE